MIRGQAPYAQRHPLDRFCLWSKASLPSERRAPGFPRWRGGHEMMLEKIYRQPGERHAHQAAGQGQQGCFRRTERKMKPRVEPSDGGHQFLSAVPWSP